MLSPPFISVIRVTLNIPFAPAAVDTSVSCSFWGRKRLENFQTPRRMGNRPRKPIGSEGNTSERPKPIMLMHTMMVNPMYWPMTIFHGVRTLLVVASAKKVIKTKRSSMLVMANVAQASPRVLPNCMAEVNRVRVLVDN
jgi:hypothetical protein